MLRAALTALALFALPACAHAEGDPVGRGDLPGVQATARVIIQALPDTQYVDWGYRWDAMSIRISRFVRWHIYAPDPRDRAADAIAQRNGWLDGGGESIDVSVYGDDEHVTMLSFEYDRFLALDLLQGLRDSGAEVSFQADYETYSEYIVTPAGRAPGLLTLRRTCPREGAAYVRQCQDSAELTFNPFE